MRSLVALSLFVSLTLSAFAADWREVHASALEASTGGDVEKSEALLRQSWKLAETSTQRAVSANDLGVTLHALTRDKEAKLWLERSYRLWPSIENALRNTAQTAEALAVVERILGEYAEAEEVLRNTLALDLGECESRAVLLNQLGDILRELGRFTEARAALDAALRIPGISPAVQAGAAIGLADLDRSAHLWPASIEKWNRGLAIAREHGWRLMEAGALRGLADTLVDEGETARAEPLLNRALAIFEGAERAQPEVASTLQSRARLMIADGKPALATEALERALHIQEKTTGPNHPQVAIIFEMLGDAATRRGRMDEARGQYDRARAIMASNFGEASVMAAAVRASWALDEQRAGLDAAAAKDYEGALAVLREAGPDTRTLLLSVMRNYADALDGAHRKHEASAVRSQMKTAFSR